MPRLALVAATVTLLGCGSHVAATRTAPPTATRAAAPAASPLRWAAVGHVRGVVDLSTPRPDGTILIAGRGRLLTWRPGAPTSPFAPSYTAPAGLEPYIALAGPGLTGAGCTFPQGVLYALRLRGGDGVTAISATGVVRTFARLPSTSLEDGIAFDTTGRFGHRLLVTATDHGVGIVYAIDCRGHVQTLTRSTPWLEGGIAVAPASFGRFAGDLIAPNEHDGTLHAVAPNGAVMLVARSGVPAGQDIGVESLGFVPASYGEAVVADRHTPGNPHPGDDLILGLSRAALGGSGVPAGALLAVSEGGAQTVAVVCPSGGGVCTVRLVASGPPEAHIEGHVVFTK
jgi:hypothetical protein